MIMEENTQLPKEVADEIEIKAQEYARTYSGTKLIKRPYIAGATAYANKLHQADNANKALEEKNRGLVEENAKLKEQATGWRPLLEDVFRKHESGLLPDRFIYEKIKTFLYGE